jgi:hypothetical protein
VQFLLIDQDRHHECCLLAHCYAPESPATVTFLARRAAMLFIQPIGLQHRKAHRIQRTYSITD